MFLRSPKQRVGVIGMSVLLTAVISLLFIQTLNAQEDGRKKELLPVNITMTKQVDHPSARPGDTLHYTININNSGDVIAPNVVFTDSLPAELSYVANTLAVTGGGNFGTDGTVISWTGHLNPNGGAVSLTFDATLANNLAVGQTVTNTAQLQGPDSLLEDSVGTTIQSETTHFVYLPIIARPDPIVTLNPIELPTSIDIFVTNQWRVAWSSVGLGGGQYELQEADNIDFIGATTYSPGVAPFYDISHATSAANRYYYRVRIIDGGGNGPWSNVEMQVALFIDNFDDPSTGWEIRREDTDDVDNSVEYKNGDLYLKIRSRWDYGLASPLTAVPSDWETYEIKTRVRLGDGIDNLHSYAIIFGGDWNGQDCPNGDFSSCFNHYYRLKVIWTGSPNKMRVQLKRIDYHDASDNAGRGVALYGYTELKVDDPDSWNIWRFRIDRQAGTIDIFAGDKFITTVHSQEYINSPYFGVMAADDEYSGTAAYFDYYYVYPN